MARKKIETIIKEKIRPIELNEVGESKISQLVSKYPYNLLLECIDIGVSTYFRYEDGKLTDESVNKFLNKLGGIAHNKSQTPIQQQIIYFDNLGKRTFSYWNSQKARCLMNGYIDALFNLGYSEEKVLEDLQGETLYMTQTSRNWSQWASTIEAWTQELNGVDDNITIEDFGSILPEEMIGGVSANLQSLCKQINASYEHNLFDCTSVMMRRLLEGLLVLTYVNNGIESEIMDASGRQHISLDKIIKNAENNKTINLSSNTKKDMKLFKDLGNYSAHKIWYNCTKGDIEPHALKYRAIIEELFYKAKIK